MSRDGTSTRTRLIRAGEQLFAARGIDRVQLRDINELAGQRNESALHYHFGSRQGLLDLILAKHGDDVQEGTRRRLEARSGQATGADELHHLIAALVVPLSEKLRSEDGRDYLRILVQILGQEDLVRAGALTAPWVAAPVRACMERIEGCLGHLPEGLRRERTARLAELSLVSIARRAQEVQEGRPTLVSEATFVANLIEMSVAALLAPLPCRPAEVHRG
ncbi:MAG TPA: helix-turn-helix domain-containing protein [Acidimicrobiales bacterium]|nr:helix-turn-helix domain-containing protein [Acidimicrobiales bacterium]